METIIPYSGMSWGYIGLYRDNGKEHGNYSWTFQLQKRVWVLLAWDPSEKLACTTRPSKYSMEAS